MHKKHTHEHTHEHTHTHTSQAYEMAMGVGGAGKLNSQDRLKLDNQIARSTKNVYRDYVDREMVDLSHISVCIISSNKVLLPLYHTPLTTFDHSLFHTFSLTLCLNNLDRSRDSQERNFSSPENDCEIS
jgi:hypothetical protein